MTKQFGKLKLHFSKRGIAYKWGEGDIRRFSFERRQADAPDAYAPADDGYDHGAYYTAAAPAYETGYGDIPDYDAEQGGYYDEASGAPRSGSYEFLYRNDWVMWALLVLLPPLGIWILWKRDRFDQLVRIGISALSAIWFIVMLWWLFSLMFGTTPDKNESNISAGLPPTQTQAPVTLGGTEDDGANEYDVTTPSTVAPTTSSNPSATPNSGAEDTSGDTNTSTEDGDVYATATGPYYHKTNDCSQISGTPGKLTLAAARSQSKQPCPTCYASESGTSSSAKYWATKSGKSYHVIKTCSGMKNAKAYTATQARKEGKGPCPACIGVYYMTKNGKHYHKTASCSGMQGAKRATTSEIKASKKTACPTCIGSKKKTTTSAKTYYATVGGTYYHTKSTCSGMKDAKRITLSQASAQKKKACPVCVSKKSTTTTSYYATTSGKYYHVKSTCSGMKGATKVTLTTAKKRGQKPCPTCIPKKTSSSTTAYYATELGKYYHKTATCSGMKNAKKITLATARNKNKTACPVCLPKKNSNTYVYTATSNKYYHSKSGCSGIMSAKKVTLSSAKSAGKTACPVCMKTTYYYAVTGGKYYHKVSTCSGMKNASKITLVSAKSRGLTACTVCVNPKVSSSDKKTYCYATPGGRYYHKVKNCQGLKNAKKVTLAFAKKQGKTACPVCVKKSGTSSITTQSADSKVSCYLIKSGTYYHAKRSCAKIKGKSGVVKTSVNTAKKNKKTACPDCVGTNLRTYVYVIPTGLLYHRKSTCSGMKNPMKLTLETALDRAYKRCTKCNAPAKK